MIKALVFDADNTLHRSENKEKAYEGMYRFLAERTGIAPGRIRDAHKKAVERVKNSLEPELRRHDHSVRKALEELRVGDADPLSREAVSLFWACILSGIVEMPGAKKAVAALCKKYRVAIASDEFRENLVRKLNRVFGSWEDYFEFLVTPEDTHSMKPSGRYYAIALERFGLDCREVAVVGDSWRRDLEPAAGLGLSTILVAQEKEGRPDAWLRDMKGLEAAVRSLN